MRDVPEKHETLSSSVHWRGRVVRHDEKVGRVQVRETKPRRRDREKESQTWETYPDTPLATAGAILISKGADHFIVRVCN
jgi:hypothetical protein